MSMCDIRKCTVHVTACTDTTVPCSIPLDKGELIITPTSISFNQHGKVMYVYKAIVPFTRSQLLRLNDVESHDPDEYITAIKYDKRIDDYGRMNSIQDSTFLYDLGKRIAEGRIDRCVDWNCHYNKQYICTRCLADIEQSISLRQQLSTEKSTVRQYAKIIREKDKEIDDLRKQLISRTY